MERSITAFEAPALLGAHTTLNLHALYQRLAGAPEAPPTAGLASFIADGAVAFVAEQNRWSKPVRHDFRKGPDDGLEIVGKGRAYRCSDDEGEFVAIFAHLAAYMHGQTWSKAGAPPEAFVVQANWVAMLADVQRMAYVVLADKRQIVYWLKRDETIVDRLKAAVADMKRRLEANEPPAVDELPSVVAPPAPTPGPNDAPVDLDELCTRWRAGQVSRSGAQNALQVAEIVYDAATAALKKAIPPGGHHDHEGVRIHHNAKTERLTEEKIDGLYF